MRRVFTLLCLLVFSSPLIAQQINLDWASSDKSLSCPAETGRQSSIPISITHLNDILYTYTVETNTQYTTLDDFSQLPSLKEASMAGCPTILHDTGAAYTAVAQKMQSDPSINPKQSDGSYASVKLADTLKAWSAVVASSDYIGLVKEVADLKSCSYNDPSDQKIQKPGAPFIRVLCE